MLSQVLGASLATPFTSPITLPNSNSVKSHSHFSLFYAYIFVVCIRVCKFGYLVVLSWNLVDIDRIFGEDTKTVEVYESRTKDIVAAAVRGFNGLLALFLFCCFEFSVFVVVEVIKLRLLLFSCLCRDCVCVWTDE